MRKCELQWLLVAVHMGRWRRAGLIAKGRGEGCRWSQAALLVGHAVPWAKWPAGGHVSVQEASCLAGKSVHWDYLVIKDVERRRLSRLPQIWVCAVVIWGREQHQGWRETWTSSDLESHQGFLLFPHLLVKPNNSSVLQQHPGSQLHICNELQLPPDHGLGLRSHVGLQYLSDMLRDCWCIQSITEHRHRCPTICNKMDGDKAYAFRLR